MQFAEKLLLVIKNQQVSSHEWLFDFCVHSNYPLLIFIDFRSSDSALHFVRIHRSRHRSFCSADFTALTTEGRHYKPEELRPSGLPCLKPQGFPSFLESGRGRWEECEDRTGSSLIVPEWQGPKSNSWLSTNPHFFFLAERREWDKPGG